MYFWKMFSKKVIYNCKFLTFDKKMTSAKKEKKTISEFIVTILDFVIPSPRFYMDYMVQTY